MAFDVEQASYISGFVAGLFTVIRFAEKRLDRGRNGSLSSRVRQLESDNDSMETRLANIEHRDLHFRLERAEAALRQIARDAAR